MVDIGIDLKNPTYDPTPAPNTTVVPRDRMSVRDLPNIKNYINVGFEVCAAVVLRSKAPLNVAHFPCLLSEMPIFNRCILHGPIVKCRGLCTK